MRRTDRRSVLAVAGVRVWIVAIPHGTRCDSLSMLPPRHVGSLDDAVGGLDDAAYTGMPVVDNRAACRAHPLASLIAPSGPTTNERRLVAWRQVHGLPRGRLAVGDADQLRRLLKIGMGFRLGAAEVVALRAAAIAAQALHTLAPPLADPGGWLGLARRGAASSQQYVLLKRSRDCRVGLTRRQRLELSVLRASGRDNHQPLALQGRRCHLPLSG